MLFPDHAKLTNKSMDNVYKGHFSDYRRKMLKIRWLKAAKIKYSNLQRNDL